MAKHDPADVVKVEKLLQLATPCLAICAGKDCARAGAKHVIRAVHAALEESELADSVAVRLTKCQDYCDDGPVLTVLPGAYTYVKLDADSARKLVNEHVCNGRPVLEQLHKRARRKLKRQLA